MLRTFGVTFFKLKLNKKVRYIFLSKTKCTHKKQNSSWVYLNCAKVRECWAKDVNLMFIRRSKDALDIF